MPTLDNLEKAANAKTEDESYKQGVELVLKQFTDTETAVAALYVEKPKVTPKKVINKKINTLKNKHKKSSFWSKIFKKGKK